MDLQFISLGKLDYEMALERQYELRRQRQSGEIPDTILTVEHPKVITHGRRDAQGDYLISQEALKEKGFKIIGVNRGGLLTYHGPGQLVAYFILSLSGRKLKVPAFVRLVEETAIKTLECFGIRGVRKEACPGVWVEDRKITSIGLAVDRGVSMHGLALNISPDLEDFSYIVPCGMKEAQVTSLERETGMKWRLSQVEKAFQEVAREIFDHSDSNDSEKNS